MFILDRNPVHNAGTGQQRTQLTVSTSMLHPVKVKKTLVVCIIK